MQALKPCRGCGQEMQGHWSHICPQCGRFFAASTPRQIAMQLGVSIAIAIVVVGALTVLLWNFA
jgi:hypothetical protein